MTQAMDLNADVQRHMTDKRPHDVELLKEWLQTAMRIELATLPPYFCGYWSIKDSNSEVATLISSVADEEMLHLALAGNMLSAIGGTPRPTSGVPTYPGTLPGNVDAGLTVFLGGLTKDYVHQVFMGIETPECLKEHSYTIGNFYTDLWRMFRQVKPDIHASAPQVVTDSLSHNPFAITCLHDVDRAITVIKEQGEGTSTEPDVPAWPDELAHYYKFEEISREQKLVHENGKWVWKDKGSLPFPPPDHLHPMAEVPAGGWSSNPATPAAVRALLKEFNQQYTLILFHLEQAWKQHGDISKAVEAMWKINDLGPQLMTKPLPPQLGKGNFGPEFRVDQNVLAQESAQATK